MTHIDTLEVLPAPSVLDAFLARLGGPDTTLEIDLWEDDGLGLAHLVVGTPDLTIELDVEAFPMPSGLVMSGVPHLSSDSIERLAVAGLLLDRTFITATARIEMAVAQLVHQRGLAVS